MSVEYSSAPEMKRPIIRKLESTTEEPNLQIDWLDYNGKFFRKFYDISLIVRISSIFANDAELKHDLNANVRAVRLPWIGDTVQ